MESVRLRKILQDVSEGQLTSAEAFEQLKSLGPEHLGFATIDHHRDLRCGFPEVVLCDGKTHDQAIRIVDSILQRSSKLLATRVDPELAAAIKEKHPDACYHESARAVTVRRTECVKYKGRILIVSAGTSDMPVAEEARVTAEIMDNDVEVIYDVGVAGIHRLFDRKDDIMASDSIVVVAGMEGALASVVAGLVECPVVAVPTSVGYGASFGGLAALLGMLNSCSPGVSVVNIDNGFGAGYSASIIARGK